MREYTNLPANVFHVHSTIADAVIVSLNNHAKSTRPERTMWYQGDDVPQPLWVAGEVLPESSDVSQIPKRATWLADLYGLTPLPFVFSM